jgi:hypothetical protein
MVTAASPAAVTRVSQPRPPPGATRLRGAHRQARPAGPRCGTPARSPRGARPNRRRPFSAPAGIRSRPPSPPCTTTRRAPPRPTGGRSSPGTTTSCPHRRPGAPSPAAVLGRAVAVGHVLGAAACLRETDRLREVLGRGTLVVRPRPAELAVEDGQLGAQRLGLGVHAAVVGQQRRVAPAQRALAGALIVRDRRRRAWSAVAPLFDAGAKLGLGAEPSARNASPRGPFGERGE